MISTAMLLSSQAAINSNISRSVIVLIFMQNNEATLYLFLCSYHFSTVFSAPSSCARSYLFQGGRCTATNPGQLLFQQRHFDFDFARCRQAHFCWLITPAARLSSRPAAAEKCVNYFPPQELMRLVTVARAPELSIRPADRSQEAQSKVSAKRR